MFLVAASNRKIRVQRSSLCPLQFDRTETNVMKCDSVREHIGRSQSLCKIGWKRMTTRRCVTVWDCHWKGYLVVFFAPSGDFADSRSSLYHRHPFLLFLLLLSFSLFLFPLPPPLARYPLYYSIVLYYTHYTDKIWRRPRMVQPQSQQSFEFKYEVSCIDIPFIILPFDTVFHSTWRRGLLLRSIDWIE